MTVELSRMISIFQISIWVSLSLLQLIRG